MRIWPVPSVFIWYLLYCMLFQLDPYSCLPLHVQPKSISLFLPTPCPKSLLHHGEVYTIMWVRPPLPPPDITASLIHILPFPESVLSPCSSPVLEPLLLLPSELESNGFLSPSLYWHMFYLLMHFFFRFQKQNTNL